MKATAQLSHARGKIMALDQEKATLRVQGFVLNKTFRVVSDAAIVTTTRPAATLKDLRLGDRVDVYYATVDTEHIAYRVSQAEVPAHWQAA